MIIISLALPVDETGLKQANAGCEAADTRHVIGAALLLVSSLPALLLGLTPLRSPDDGTSRRGLDQRAARVEASAAVEKVPRLC